MNRFATVCVDVFKQRELSDGAKVLYTLMIDYMNDERVCYPTIETMSKQLGCSKRKVDRNLKELREFGLVRIWRKPPSFNNVYIILPMELVENLNKEEVIKVEEDNQYIGTKEEFERYLVKIKLILSESVGEPKQPRKAKPKKTEEEKEKEVLEKIENNEKLNSNDLTRLYMILYSEIRGEKYRPYWQTEPKIMKEMFMDKGISGELAKELITVYLEKYDYHFKSDKFKKPRILSLGVAFIWEKLIVLADYERKNIARKDVLTDEWF